MREQCTADYLWNSKTMEAYRKVTQLKTHTGKAKENEREGERERERIEIEFHKITATTRK